MRPCLAVFLLVLSLVLFETHCIRLDKEKSSEKHHKIHEDKTTVLTKPSKDDVEEVILCKDGGCTGTMKKRVHRVPKKSHHHWLPSVHEDYYGPRRHRPRHH